jgi:hypothetical protein
MAISDLSLPIVAGGAISFTFFAKLHQVEFYYPIVLICSIGIFAIYLYDHFSDLKSVGHVAYGEPFWILYRFKKFWFALTAVSIIIASILFFTQLRRVYIMPGCAVAILVLGYYLFRKFAAKKWQGKLKELWISLVATMALGGITAWISSAEIQWLLLLSLFVICFQNMLLFSWIDYEQDMKNNNPTLAIDSGIPFVVWLLDICALINFALLADLWYSDGYSLDKPIFMAMQLQLVIVRVLCEYTKPNRIYRFWTDMVFVLPIIYLL